MRRDFLRGSVEAREARHRRRVLVLTGVLTIVATSPVLVHHLTSRVGDALAGRDHIWMMCLVALHQLLAPVHTLFHLLLILGIVYAVADRGRAWYRMHHALRLLQARGASPADAVFAAAEAAGVPHDLIHLADGLPNPAFTTGWLRPRIYVDAQLQHLLTSEQLVAVLAHEYAHVCRRDPMRLTLLRALGATLFWLPALRRLAEDVADDAEIAADNFAVRGDPMILASAIVALAQWRMPGGVSADAVAPSGGGSRFVGFLRDTMLDRRIHRLLGNEPPIVTHVTWRSIVTALSALLLAWSSGMAVAHPMTVDSAHCAHQHAWAYQHLFCRSYAEVTNDARCPHEHRTDL